MSGSNERREGKGVRKERGERGIVPVRRKEIEMLLMRLERQGFEVGKVISWPVGIKIGIGMRN